MQWQQEHTTCWFMAMIRLTQSLSGVPSFWNGLPSHVTMTSAPSLAIFWQCLKTFLFHLSYRPSHLICYTALFNCRPRDNFCYLGHTIILMMMMMMMMSVHWWHQLYIVSMLLFWIRLWCAGFIAFMISVLVFLLLALLGVPVHIVYHKFLSLAVTSIVFSFILALFLYGKSLRADSSALAEGGNTGEIFCCLLMMHYCQLLGVTVFSLYIELLTSGVITSSASRRKLVRVPPACYFYWVFKTAFIGVLCHNDRKY